MKKLSLALLLGCALLGCPDKGGDPKPDPAASAKVPAKTAPAAAPASAAKAGGGW